MRCSLKILEWIYNSDGVSVEILKTSNKQNHSSFYASGVKLPTGKLVRAILEGESEVVLLFLVLFSSPLSCFTMCSEHTRFLIERLFNFRVNVLCLSSNGGWGGGGGGGSGRP